MVEYRALTKPYARLLGLNRSIPLTAAAPASLARDYDFCVAELSSAAAEDMSEFLLPGDAVFSGAGSRTQYVQTAILRSKIEQLLSYLELMFHLSDRTLEIGTLFNSIKDDELRSRCADLLSAPRHFDRAINQATQVMEDRIRTKSGTDTKLTGTQLVNEFMKTDLSRSPIKISNEQDEHEGFCHISRGIMQAFRNPTHHNIAEKFSREDALKVCAFVDSLLRVLDAAEVKQ